MKKIRLTKGPTLLFVICSLVVLSLTSCASGPASAGIRPSTVAPCSTANLVVWLNTQSNGAAGSIYYTLEFTNLSTRSCSLAGYPGVSAVSLRGTQLGSAASRNPSVTKKSITIAASASAVATLQIVEAGNYPATECAMKTAAGIRVYPPGQKASKVVPFPFSACSKSGPNFLSIAAVQKQ